MSEEPRCSQCNQPISLKTALLIIDTFAAEACPWQDCRHPACVRVRGLADAERSRLGAVRNPDLITLGEANVAVQRIIEQARRKEDVKDAVVKIIERIQRAIDHDAFDSIALAQEIEIARQAVREAGH
jgi:hypothetical protein